MRPSRIRQVWEQDRVVLNGWLAIPSSFSAEIMAKQGWDSLTIDMQHGLIDYQAAVEMLTGISTTEVAPLVRVPWLDSGIIMKMLDAGSYGILCPMINNRRDAEELVSACRYPPRGHRSYGPIRALPYAGADYLEHADETIVVLALVETKEALNNLDDIMTVEGLDGVYVGPSDLSLSLGLQPKIEPDEPKLLEAFDTILATSVRHGIQVGIHTATASYAKRMVGKGFQFVTVSSDARLVMTGASDAVSELRRLNTGLESGGG